MEGLGSMCKLLGSGFIQDEPLETGYANHMYTWKQRVDSSIEILSF